jgi:hypothetical protein
MQASPGFWSSWVDSWRSYEGPTGVREVRGSPAARNRKGRAGYRRRSSGSIPARAGLGVEGGSLGELPGGTAKLLPWSELGCMGAAGPRWSRGAAWRSKRAVALGLRWRLQWRG